MVDADDEHQREVHWKLRPYLQVLQHCHRQRWQCGSCEDEAGYICSGRWCAYCDGDAVCNEHNDGAGLDGDGFGHFVDRTGRVGHSQTH